MGGGPVLPPTDATVGSEFIIRHKVFIDEVNALNHCFARGEIPGFEPEELEGN